MAPAVFAVIAEHMDRQGSVAPGGGLRGAYSLRYGGIHTATETFTLFRREDGGTSLQSLIRMADPRLDRQVGIELDKAGLPRAATVMLHQDGRYSNALFSIRGAVVTCELDCDLFGRVSQTLTLESEVAMFGTHALANDAWFTRLHEPDGPALQTFECPVSSVSERGDSGLLVTRTRISIERRARGRTTTAAGTFETEHFDIAFGHLPPLEVQVRSDDQLLVRMDWKQGDVIVTLDELNKE